jgi:hypothetical protein
MRCGIALLVLGACTHRGPGTASRPVLPFVTYEATQTFGEVRVVPALRLHGPLEPELGSFFGVALPAGPIATRITRTAQLEELTAEVGLALPGEVNGELGERWTGQFRSHRMPNTARQHLEEALRGQRDLELAFAGAAKAVGGDAVLFSWMDQLEASPLTLRDLPGEVVDTPAGPVVVDDADQPYLVTAQVGMALVATGGEVVIRYHDTYETVLSGARGPDVAGRDIAEMMAHEIAKVWFTDPRLEDAAGQVGQLPLRASPVEPDAALAWK